jgi:hypothetical protein
VLRTDQTGEVTDDGLVVTKRTSQRVHSDRMEKMWEEVNKNQRLPQKSEKREPLQRNVSEM